MSESQLIWTAERPTVPGYYWVANDDGTFGCVQFTKPADKSWEGTLFAGPISEPSPAPLPGETGEVPVQSG